MGEYDRAIATAKRLIAKKGELCTYYSAATNDEHEVRIAFLPNTSRNTRTQTADMEDIPSSGTIGYMADEGFRPTKLDTVVRSDGRTYTIVDRNGIETLEPDGNPILHTIQFVQ